MVRKGKLAKSSSLEHTKREAGLKEPVDKHDKVMVKFPEVSDVEFEAVLNGEQVYAIKDILVRIFAWKSTELEELERNACLYVKPDYICAIEGGYVTCVRSSQNEFMQRQVGKVLESFIFLRKTLFKLDLKSAQASSPDLVVRSDHVGFASYVKLTKKFSKEIEAQIIKSFKGNVDKNN